MRIRKHSNQPTSTTKYSISPSPVRGVVVVVWFTNDTIFILWLNDPLLLVNNSHVEEQARHVEWMMILFCSTVTKKQETGTHPKKGTSPRTTRRKVRQQNKTQ